MRSQVIRVVSDQVERSTYQQTHAPGTRSKQGCDSGNPSGGSRFGSCQPALGSWVAL